MVVVKIGDGLGNQLYNYVCGYVVARHDHDTLKLDTSDCDNSTLREYMLDNFCLDAHERESFSNKTLWDKIYKKLRRNLKYHVIKENGKLLGSSDTRLFKEKKYRDKYLYGYWISVEYFRLYENDILRQLRPAYKQSDEVLRTTQFLKENNTCAIHVRGGDKKMFPLEYFYKAVSIVSEKVEEVMFIVFTNEREQAIEVLQELGIKYRFISDFGKFSDIDEFFLMSSCKNQIVPNSTYSRWAALINSNENKIVVAPDEGVRNCHMYPSDWVLIK